MTLDPHNQATHVISNYIRIEYREKAYIKLSDTSVNYDKIDCDDW